MKNNAGLIVAAGLSSRMGMFKPLLKIGDKTFIEHIIDKFKLLGLSPIVVVVGHKSESLSEKFKDRDIKFIKNDKFYETDMFYSIKLGLEYLENKSNRIFITPCDNPLFSVRTMEELLKYDDEIVIPINKNPGHPILIKNFIISEILNFNGEGGLKAFLETKKDKKYVDVDDPAIDLDADYFSDYEKMLDYYNTKKGIRSIYFLRHGDIEKPNKEKIYYSRSDFKLNEIGKIKLKDQIEYFENIDIKNIYTSPLSRCKDSALEFNKKKQVDNFNICDDLLEIKLGAWEGKSFSYIKENFPKEFRERGKDINFCPPKGESLKMAYDRVDSVLRKIIKSTDGNTLIFSHKGLIQILLAAEDKNLLKAWDYNIGPGSITRFDLLGEKLNLIYYGRLAKNYPSDEEIRFIYRDLELEENIIKHMVNVMNIAKILTSSLEDIGYRLDWELLRAASLLHDIKRKEKNHELKSAKYMEKLGYKGLSEIIKNHNSYREIKGKINESDILYLADKYSLEDKFVSIDQRFNASLKKCNNEEALYYHNKRYEYAKNIEKIIEEKTKLNSETILKRLSDDNERFII